MSNEKIIREPIGKLDDIKIIDNNEPIVRLDKFCPQIVIDLSAEVKSHEKHAYVRETVAKKLCLAQKNLANGYRLRIWDAWRDPLRQRQKYQNYYHQLKKENPDWGENILRRQTNRMLFPVDKKTPPPHSTGAAVDLTIIDKYGKDLDMMSPFSERYSEARTFSTKISDLAQKNRNKLFDVMTNAGFTNYSFEWWHYTYGDSAWALRLNRKTAIYGKTKPKGWPSTDIQY